MKKVGNYLKSDKGSITTVVMVTVLFFVTILSTAYIVTATIRKSQLKSEITAKEVYEKDFKNVDEIITDLRNAGYNPASEGVTIPTGFYYVGGTKNSGVVISDEQVDENRYQGQATVGTDLQGNQFVWIPVTYSNFHLIEGYYYGSFDSMLSQGTNPSREAGATATAGTPLAKNSTAGTSKSIAMYKSVKDNGGFYIARYEAGIANVDTNENPVANSSLGTKVVTTGEVKPLSKAGLGVWNYIAWGGSGTDVNGLPGNDTADGAVKVARSMYTKSSTCGVTSTLCYGVQWDAVMQFLDSTYVNADGTCSSIVSDSTNKGNYSGSLKPTGYYAEKNIYDLAGNVWEWTMEAYGSDHRVGRGGDFVYDSGSNDPASVRCGNFPYNRDNSIGFRVALYL